MKKTAVCISSFDHYVGRLDNVADYLRRLGYECVNITSDYDHIRKQPKSAARDGSIVVHTMPYKRNLSFARVRSHILFAREAFAQAQRLQPELLFVHTPPNSLAYEAAKYKKRNPNARIILDIYDLWPESFPDQWVKRISVLPFRLWAEFRSRGIRSADFVTLQCALYEQRLARQLEGKEHCVLPLCRDFTAGEPLAPVSDGLGLCYLGSINNIIDIPAIAQLIKEISLLRPVTLHIIGDGERRAEFSTAARDAGAGVEEHGIVFDPRQRQDIFDRCDFGLNMMKASVSVGMTMKSADYLAGGLPLLSNIGADTEALLEKFGAGFNVRRGEERQTAAAIAAMTDEDRLNMRLAVRRTYEQAISPAVFDRALEKVFGSIGEDKL